MEFRTNLNVESIINSSDNVLKKSIVDNYNNYNIEAYDVCHIVESIDDDDYKMNFLMTLNRNEFRIYQIVLIALSISSDLYKKEIIKYRRKYGIDNDSNLLKVIFSMSDDSINDMLLNYKDYNFPSTTFCHIVCSLRNDEMKRKVINDYKYFNFNDFDISKVVASMDDDNYKKNCVNKLFKSYSDPSCIATVVRSISDDLYKYNVFNNYKKYNFSNVDIFLIAQSFKDNGYVYKILDDYRKYDFGLDTLASIVTCISDDYYKTSIVIENIYNFNCVQLTKIVDSLSFTDTKVKLMNILYKKGAFGKNVMNKSIVLPENMSIGIEIESEGENSNVISTDVLPKGWEAKKDTTLKDGIEVTSPILYKGDENQIGDVCSMLQEFNQYVTNRCAGHIHIGSSFFEGDVNSFKNLLEIFANVEGIMYLISNEEGDIPRRNVFKYSTPISKRITSFNEVKNLDFSTIDDFNKFSDIIKIVQGSRFVSINFKNLGLSIKDTIEFRVPNGTIDANVWIDNINLFGNLMNAAKRISNIQKKDIGEMTDSDKIALYFYEKIKDPNISERNRLKFLLNLFPDSLDKKVYLNRFDVNRELSRGLPSEDLVDYVENLRPIVVSKCSDELKSKVIEAYEKNFGKSKKTKKAR